MKKEERKEYYKAYYQSHKKERKAYRQSHKEKAKAYMKEYYEANKEERKAYMKFYNQSHKDEIYARRKSDLNSAGQTKDSIRNKSKYYLKKHGTKIDGYEIHHCCTYTEPYKFIYCSKETHIKIHQYLRDNNIDADSDHYEQIKHLLDDSVFLYNINP